MPRLSLRLLKYPLEQRLFYSQIKYNMNGGNNYCWRSWEVYTKENIYD